MPPNLNLNAGFFPRLLETHRNVLRWETLTEWDSLERRCLRETDGVARHLILELTVILVRYE